MTRDIEIVQPPGPHNRLYHLVGLGFLALNSWRHRIRGYRTPRPWFSRDTGRILRYDRAVFSNWQRHLEDYLEFEFNLDGRTVLEIGPGTDLGTGLLWLAAGAESYVGVDAHTLVTGKTRGLHEELARLIAGADATLLERLLDAVRRLHANEDGPLRYRVMAGFNLEKLDLDGFDLVVSHSALEHVAKIERSIESLSKRVSDRAHLVAEIDLQTHTRWIRDHDPLNIYRYRNNTWRTFSFSGIPNRVRPDTYFEALEKHEWTDLRIYPQRVLPMDYVQRVEHTLDQQFRDDPEHMSWLSIVICASRSGERSWRGGEPRE
jgi:SAM-dependent methyltransferase